MTQWVSLLRFNLKEGGKRKGALRALARTQRWAFKRGEGRETRGQKKPYTEIGRKCFLSFARTVPQETFGFGLNRRAEGEAKKKLGRKKRLHRTRYLDDR